MSRILEIVRDGRGNSRNSCSTFAQHADVCTVSSHLTASRVAIAYCVEFSGIVGALLWRRLIQYLLALLLTLLLVFRLVQKKYYVLIDVSISFSSLFLRSTEGCKPIGLPTRAFSARGGFLEGRAKSDISVSLARRSISIAIWWSFPRNTENHAQLDKVRLCSGLEN